jgi:hypothetical protein
VNSSANSIKVAAHGVCLLLCHLAATNLTVLKPLKRPNRWIGWGESPAPALRLQK